MRVSCMWLAPAVAVTLLIACSEQGQTPTAATPTAVKTMAADYTNNPDGGGPWIARYTSLDWSVGWDNADVTLHATHTTFPISWLGVPWDDAVCGPQTDRPTMSLHEISHWDPTHTDPSARYIENGGSDSVWIIVQDPTHDGPCNHRALVANGWGRLHYNDNNGTNSGTQDAWSYKADGTLMTPGGQQVHYEGHMSCVYWGGTGKCSTDINLH